MTNLTKIDRNLAKPSPSETEGGKGRIKLWVGLLLDPWWDEPEAPDYSRQPVFLSGGTELLYNVSDVKFDSAQNDWGQVAAFAIYATKQDEEEICGGAIGGLPIAIHKGDSISLTSYSIVISGPAARRIARYFS